MSNSTPNDTSVEMADVDKRTTPIPVPKRRPSALEKITSALLGNGEEDNKFSDLPVRSPSGCRVLSKLARENLKHQIQSGSHHTVQVNPVDNVFPVNGASPDVLIKQDPHSGGPVKRNSGIAKKSNSGIKPAKSDPVADEADGTPWHAMSMSQMYSTLECTDKGISPQERQERLKPERYGRNMITPPPTVHWFVRFLKTLIGGFQAMMFVGALLCFIVYGIDPEDYQTLTLGLMLVVVVLATSVFQSYQEGKADDVMGALRALVADEVTIHYNGQSSVIAAVELVPGDIVELRGGDKVPADVRVLTSADLKVNNASLTGENIDIKLGPDPNHSRIFEAKNIARSGCNFTNGKGLGIVFATGDNTFFGQIAKSTTTTERPETLMKREVNRLILFMSIVAIVIGLTFLILAITVGYEVIEAIVFTIGIIVANVPEGLLPQLTVALSLTASKLKDKQVLVSNLEIIETLGAVSVICSDKTGTLTCNRMTVAHVVYNQTIYQSPQVQPDANYPTINTSDDTFQMLQQIASLNTDASFTKKTGDDVLKWDAKGDASEQAIIKFVQPYRDIVDYRSKCKRHATIPFNSTNKFMLSINEQENGRDSTPLFVFMKGAPERIFDRCSSHVNVKGEVVDLDVTGREEWEKLNTTLGKKGERVLAFAYAELDRSEFPPGFKFDVESDTPNVPMSGLTLVGLMALMDPPREGVKEAVQACFKAGVKVFMVTGDHPVTALAISKNIGLVTKMTAEELTEAGKPVPKDFRDAIVIHGTSMLTFTEDDWTRVLEHEQIVFARTMPQQKQNIVMHLNKLGYVVAMTGDGVNDAPALKAANVGVAMGSGAQVAKEAAQIVILNDNFAAIVEGIREGRQIFENMKKAISYVLSSNIPELIPFLVFIAGKFPLGIEILVILCIDLGTDILPAIALAYEEAEDAIMERPPRTANDHLVSPQLMLVAYLTIGMFENIAAFFAFIYVFEDDGFTFNSMFGAGIQYRKHVSEISDSQRDFFRKWCSNNTQYKGNCHDDREFYHYRQDLLNRAQSAFFITIIYGQIGNLIARKTQYSTAFTKWRFFHNRMILISFAKMIFIAVFLIWVPGLNNAFLLGSINGKHATCGLWVLPFILFWEETRKYFIRQNPKGFVAWMTLF